jgi:uridine kinase
VAARLAARGPGGRLRVGVDGVCGSGKTTFAGDLAGFVAAAGRAVVLIDNTDPGAPVIRRLHGAPAVP